MGKILFVKRNEIEGKSDVSYVAGKIMFVNEAEVGEDKRPMMFVSMIVDVYDKETRKTEKQYLSISIGNSEKFALYDQAKKANLAPGRFVTFAVIRMRDTDPANDGTRRMIASAINFYTEYFIPLDEGHALITGAIRGVREVENGYVFSVPVHRGEDTTWYSVLARDGEKLRIANRASKLGRGSRACFICGALDTKESDGKTYNDLRCFDFVAQRPEQRK